MTTQTNTTNLNVPLLQILCIATFCTLSLIFGLSTIVVIPLLLLKQIAYAGLNIQLVVWGQIILGTIWVFTIWKAGCEYHELLIYKHVHE